MDVAMACFTRLAITFAICLDVAAGATTTMGVITFRTVTEDITCIIIITMGITCRTIMDATCRIMESVMDTMGDMVITSVGMDTMVVTEDTAIMADTVTCADATDTMVVTDATLDAATVTTDAVTDAIMATMLVVVTASTIVTASTVVVMVIMLVDAIMGSITASTTGDSVTTVIVTAGTRRCMRTIASSIASTTNWPVIIGEDIVIT